MPAQAWDWRIVADITERLEADDNFRVRAPSPGNSYGSTTTVTLDTSVETPRSTLNVIGGARLREFFGPGSDDELNSFDQNVRANYQIRGPRSSLRFDGRFNRDSSTFTDLDTVSFGGFDQTIITEGETDRFSYEYGASYTVSLDPRNSITISANQRNVDFAQNVVGLTPTENFVVGGAWSTAITPTANFLLNSSISWFEADNAEQREVETISLSGRLTGELTPTLTIYGEGGVNFFDTEVTTIGGRQSETSIGSTFDFGLTYVVGVTTLSASLSQSVSPSDIGDLRQRTGVNARLSHRINTISSFTMGGSYAVQEGATSSTTAGIATTEADREFARFFSRYSVELTRYWDLMLAYEFRWRDTGGTTSTSNKVFGTLSREFVLLP